MARVRCTAALLALAALCGSAGAHASGRAPTGLHGFVLRADEPVVHTFSRTPSFGWNPVRGARSYQFELSTSAAFTPNGTVWSAKGLKTPAVAVPLSLPWITGNPYSLYAHVRAVTRKGAGPWSARFGFSMRWATVPTPLPGVSGLLRWTPVPGASAYDIWLMDAGRRFTTRVNMADEREYYTFHQTATWTGTVHWRVRAVRLLYGQSENGLPATSHGPWSPIYTSYNPAFSASPLALDSTRTSVVSDATHTRDHETMPAFLFHGNEGLNAQPYELYRVVVSTDQDCLNVVFRGAMVGSPAYVPREVGPLSLPNDAAGEDAARSAYLPIGAEPESTSADGEDVHSNEMDAAQGATVAKVDLWDSDTTGGHYYWTVVPIDVIADEQINTTLAAAAASGATTITVANATGIAAGDTLLIGLVFPEHSSVVSVAGNAITLASPLQSFHSSGEDVVRPSGGVKYHEAELTQDACASGRMLTFGKSSDPAVTGRSAPYASGLSPNGKLVAAKKSAPKFYGAPLVAWQPTLSTDQYEVQWSHKRYPWRQAGLLKTYSTSVSLPLAPGTWYYRVRALDSLMIGSRPELSWSAPVRLVVTKPRFRVVH